MSRFVFGAVVLIIVATALVVWWSKSGGETSSPVEPEARVTAPVVAVPSVRVSAPPKAVEEVAPVPVPVAPAPPAAPEPEGAAAYQRVLERATSDATERVAALRPMMLQKCWADAHAAEQGSTAAVDLEVTFDAQGNELSRGSAEVRGSVPGVASCVVATEAGTLRIAPPGRTVTVVVRVALP